VRKFGWGDCVAKQNVSGKFFVSMEVLDHLGRPITRISTATKGARHVVHVENISGLPCNARVKARLPNGTLRIEFVDASGSAVADWDKSQYSIPKFATRDLECALRRNTGSSHSKEPIQVDDVMDGRGTLGWNSATSGVPIQISIDAA
jgi:hypothetical protein